MLSTLTDAALLDKALAAPSTVNAPLRSTSYGAYDEHPLEEPLRRVG